jgi:hypothetical protein
VLAFRYFVEGNTRVSLESEIRAENKRVAYYLLNYPDLKRGLEERRQAILNATYKPGENNPAPGRNTPREPSDPTGAVVVQLSELHERERWIQLCEDVAAGLPWKKQIILQLRQEMRGASRRTGGWRPYMQWRYSELVAKKLKKPVADVYIEREATFSEWWKQIVEYAARLAAKRGLLK